METTQYKVEQRGLSKFIFYNSNNEIIATLDYKRFNLRHAKLVTTSGDIYEFQDDTFVSKTIRVLKNDILFATIDPLHRPFMPITFNGTDGKFIISCSMLPINYKIIAPGGYKLAIITTRINFKRLNIVYHITVHPNQHTSEINNTIPFVSIYSALCFHKKRLPSFYSL